MVMHFGSMAFKQKQYDQNKGKTTRQNNSSYGSKELGVEDAKEKKTCRLEPQAKKTAWMGSA